jgi:integrase
VINNNGNIVSVRGYQKSFSALLKKLQIAHKGFHSLRHTFATRALECGMDVKTLADILGHKNPNITLNCYAHSMMEHKVAMMNRVGRLLQ